MLLCRDRGWQAASWDEMGLTETHTGVVCKVPWSLAAESLGVCSVAISQATGRDSQDALHCLLCQPPGWGQTQN